MRYLLIVLIIVLFACTGKTRRGLVFDKPQPENVRDLSSFPIRYRGTFRDKESVILLIDKNKLIRTIAFELHILKSELDSFPEIDYSHHTLHYRKRGDSYPGREKGDTIFWKESVSDTIFALSQKQVVRKLYGYLVLNSEQDSAEWQVDLLKLDFGVLKFIKVDSKEDLAKFVQIAKPGAIIDTLMPDTIKYIIHPTKKEFRSFLKIREFTTPKEYKRVR